jgi:hypothetical protein
MRRRNLLRLLLPVVVLAIAIAIALWPREGKVTRANWERVAKGMQLREVEALLGEYRPSNADFPLSDGLDRSSVDAPDWSRTTIRARNVGQPFGRQLLWQGVDGMAIIEIDDTGVSTTVWIPRSGLLARLKWFWQHLLS